MNRSVRETGRRTLVLGLPQASADSMGLFLGPVHPVLRGSTRVVLEVEGESIRAVDVQVGFLHRGFEKEAETVPVDQIFSLVERMSPLSPLLAAFGYALALERLFDVTHLVPVRARLLRVIVAELSRMADHLTCVGTTALALGASNAFFLLMDARARLWNLLEAMAGPRLGPSYLCVGGVTRAPTSSWVADLRARLPPLRRLVGRAERMLGGNPVFRERMAGVAVIDRAQVAPFGLSGPVARASGVAVDVRKDAPYGDYESFAFDVPVGSAGDNWDRYAVRMEEVRQSLRIVEQAARELGAGPLRHEDARWSLPPKAECPTPHELSPAHESLVFDGPRVPAGEVYQPLEAANGELGFGLVSDGSARLVKCRVRSPSFAHAAMLAEVLPGHFVADVVPAFASLNIVGAECDR